MSREKAQRRFSEAKAKKKASDLIDQQRWDPKALEGSKRKRVVGKQAAVLSRPCSCPGCGNARRQLGQKTLKEKSHEEITRKMGEDDGTT
jgi:hypothetical protein